MNAHGSDAVGGKPVYHVYLAGPEVFLPEPIAAGAEKKARIAAMSRAADWPFELAGLYPLDNGIPDFRADFDTGMRIYRANIDLMNRAYFAEGGYMTLGRGAGRGESALRAG